VATTNKDFRIKNGLVVEGATSTVNGNQVLTTASSIDSLSDVVITTPTTNQVLSYNGTNWVNSASGGGTTTNALTIGTGLSGTSFDGSAPVTIANTGVLSVNGSSGVITDVVKTNAANTFTTSPQQINAAASAIGLIVKANATTPGNIQEWQDSASTVKASIGSDGVLNTYSGFRSYVSGVETFSFGISSNGGFELGRTNGTTSTPYIDFHSGATAIDYDVRMIASGGTGVIGNGTLAIAAASLTTTGTFAATSTISASGLAGSLLTSTVGTALGTAAAGTATVPARADHVHPTTGLGLTSATLAQFAATTSSQLAGVISDETGSGALVFGTTPTISTPLLTLSTTSSTTEGRIAWDSTNDKILVGGTLNGTAQAIEFASSTLNISTPTFTTNAYTVVLTDKDKWLELSNGATAGTLNIPTDATANFAIGTQLNIIQTGAGQITIAAVTPGTTTVNGTPGLKLRAQWSAVTIIKRAANSWVAVGDLSA
jgi:hypothetical protein